MPKDPKTELLVCTTCRPADAPRDGRAAGQSLFDLLEEALAFVATAAQEPPAGAQLRGIACLGACSRGCVVALQSTRKASYVFGNLAPEADCVQAVMAIARQHSADAEGLLVWGQRPERLRKGLIARLPAPAGPPDSEPDA